MLLVGSAKVSKVKILSGPCHMIKGVPTFVSCVQVSVSVVFLSQNKVKILLKVKACQHFEHEN